jgi:hypothetical protein
MFISRELLYALYPIYFTLGPNSIDFTHYDLHDNNVLVYTPSNKYIHYHFHHLNGTVVEFKSKHLVKIIDYGKSFVKDASADAKKQVCSLAECGMKRCGGDSGYSFTTRKHYITPYKSNISHDLRLLAILAQILPKGEPPRVREEIYRIKQMLNLVVYKENYGTPEIFDGPPNKINNCYDAEIMLRKLVTDPYFVDINEKYTQLMDKLGDLHVYHNKMMEYIPV